MMKKIRIKTILKLKISIIFWALGTSNCHSQNNKNITLQYVGGCDTHIVHRKQLSDTILIDSSVIYYSNQKKYTIIDTIKRGIDEWYFKNNNQWILYFSKEKFHKNEKIYWWGQSYGVNPNPPFTTAIPIRMYIEKGVEIYVYQIKEINADESHKLEYHFEYTTGIIKMFDNSQSNKCKEKILKNVGNK